MERRRIFRASPPTIGIVAPTLQAYRRAGIAVQELLRQAEDRRLECELEGLDPWDVGASRQAELVCTWNAFALQTLGDALSDTSRGRVSAASSRQALAYYGQVEEWLSRARQARSNPTTYRLDISAPAPLPPWVSSGEAPAESHLAVMMVAMRRLRMHAEAGVAAFPDRDLPPIRRNLALRLRQLLAAGVSKAEYAESLVAGSPPTELRAECERHVRGAIEIFYRLGQLLAMPQALGALGRSGGSNRRTEGPPASEELRPRLSLSPPSPPVQLDTLMLPLRLLYFVLVGWWLSGIVFVLAWLLNLLVVGLPVGLWLLNRLPTLATLRPQAELWSARWEGVKAQRPLAVRAAYFLLVGWWLSGLWMGLAYAALLTILGLPLAFWMSGRVGAVTTLYRS